MVSYITFSKKVCTIISLPQKAENKLIGSYSKGV